MKKAILIIGLICISVFIFTNDLSAQCAMCKQAASSSLDNDPTSMARNLNTGILYLMAVPYILIGFIFRKQIVALWRSWRGKTNAQPE